MVDRYSGLVALLDDLVGRRSFEGLQQLQIDLVWVGLHANILVSAFESIFRRTIRKTDEYIPMEDTIHWGEVTFSCEQHRVNVLLFSYEVYYIDSSSLTIHIEA